MLLVTYTVIYAIRFVCYNTFLIEKMAYFGVGNWFYCLQM